ncbi:Efflux ABC transporter permease [Lasiodiplodia theobromae]|uniref:Efflux ABC transporter permease n=1 Tax=Lasiodiplodia theobromae TaxID=45133 RepID=UPI0015C4022C|nr:Efflux ABC transporter permease [Lasiodiplodia theobromae]KAF4543232.1 Efflux ABC transporter permease [Lasiodiplodia theobromae]
MPPRSPQNHGDLQLDPERERLRNKEAALDAREAALDARQRELDELQRRLECDQVPIIDLQESSDLDDDDLDDFLSGGRSDNTLSGRGREFVRHENNGDGLSRVRESIDSPTSKRLRSGKLRSGTGDSDRLGRSQVDFSERPAKRQRQQTTQGIQTPRQPANSAPLRTRSATVSSQRPQFKKVGPGRQQVNAERLTYCGFLPGCDVPTALASDIEAKVKSTVKYFVAQKPSRVRTWARRGNKSSWDCLRTFTMASTKTNWHSEETKRKFACTRCESGGFFCIISAEPEGEGEFLDSAIVLPMREEARLTGATPDDEFGFWRLNNGKC